MPRVDQVTRLAAELERAILAGELQPGDSLPAEREISAQQGVSRSVVREALGRLTSLGLVKSVHGSGTRVAAPNSRQVTVGYKRLLSQPKVRLADLASVRLPLETTIAALAAERRTDKHLELLDKTQIALGDESKSLEAHARADLKFHATLADATGNPFFQTVLAPIQELLIESRRHTLGRYGSPLAHAHHARILEAVRRHDSAAAAAHMREHIEANFRHLNEAGESAE